MNNSIAPLVSQSNLMRAYNLAKRSNVFEVKRLNRALGIVQSNSTKLLTDAQGKVKLDVNINEWHMATVRSCDCQDHKHTKYCKHIIASMLVVKAKQLSAKL